MITSLIIIAYIANVFLNRYLNKILYKMTMSKTPFLWFIPIITTIALLIAIVTEKGFKDNWFTGKNW